MIGGFIASLAGSAWARTVLRYGLTALAILLFLLALRRSGERAGRLAEQLETTERSHDAQPRCSKRRRVALALATIWLSGCATGASEGSRLGACPPVVEYSRDLQAQAAEAIDLLPENSAVAEMLADYAVMREQARACA